MLRNGWTLYVHPLFDGQYDRVLDRVEAAKKADPVNYRNNSAFGLLATITRYTEEVIPRDPSAPQFRQGNTLGKDNRHWFRAKFHERYRLFFRFSTKDKIIVYAWLNDESTLRKSGAKTDSYTLFQAMLKAGDPPGSLEQLLAVSRKMS